MDTVREILEEELELLRKNMTVTLRSRLSAGLLLIPEGLQVWNSETEDEPTFEEELWAAMMEPVRDIASLSSYLPFIIRGPVELLSEVRHMKFGNDQNIEILQNRIDTLEARLEMLDRLEEDMV